MSEEAFAAAVCRHLRLHLVERTHRAFDEHILEPALRYSATIPLQFLELVLPQGVRQGGVAPWRGKRVACAGPKLHRTAG